MLKKERMLIIANGPSTRELADWGFENLPDDVDTFGCGAAYRYYREINWWPTYYALCDPKVVFSHRNDLKEMVESPDVPTKRFFFSVPLSEHPRFELIPHSTTGDFCCRKALEYGYREIFLIGAEGRYVEEIMGSRPMTDEEHDKFGLEVLSLSEHHRKTLRVITETPEDNPNYFFYGYQSAGDIYSLPQTHVHRRGWHETAEFVEETGGRVLNLSQISSVNDFPRTTLTAFLNNSPAAEMPLRYGPFPREESKRIEEANLLFSLFQAGDLTASEQPLMVDVGASKGTALHAFAEAGWMVHAFEPNPPLFEALKTKYDADNLILNDVAVSDTAGAEIPFYTSEESTGIGTLKPFRDSHEVTAQVSTIRLDDYLREQSIEHVDFLKIDTEGFDLMVLKGMNLAAQQPEVILCEFEDRKTVPLGYSMHDMADHLASYGYTVYVSEWHPVIQYGIRHQWRALKRYPCELEETDAWGNLIAFQTDPGIWALSGPLNRSFNDLEPKVTKPRRPKTKVETPKPKNAASDVAKVRGQPSGARYQGISHANPDLDRDLKEALKEVAALEHQLESVYASTSWRISAPLRQLKTRAVGLFKQR